MIKTGERLKIKQAVILAGGAGTRLKPFTLKSPKPLIPINGKIFLEHLIEFLKRQGIKEIIILVGYKGHKITDKLGDGRKLGVKIKYSYTPFRNFKGEEVKSGVRILNAHEYYDPYFLLVYCDNYLPINLQKMERLYLENNAEVLVNVFSNIDGSTRNNTLVSPEGIVKKYDGTRSDPKLNGVDVGFMIVDKKVLNYLPEKNVKFEDVIFPKLIRQKKLAGYLTDQKYYSIGDPARVKTTAKFLKEKKVIFLDRDGVINKKAAKADYIKSWREFQFLPGSIEALKILCDKGYQIFIISNQAGIARGMMTGDDLKFIHKQMIKVLKKEGVRISGIYYCPHGWDQNCICRKPKPGMLHQASREHFIDLSKALFIGDDIRDKQAGEKAGVRTILLSRGSSLLKVVNQITGGDSSVHKSDEKNTERVFITGISGTAGRKLAEVLIKRGYYAGGTIHKNTPEELKDLGKTGYLKLYRADLTNSEAIKTIISKYKPTTVVHLAGKVLGSADKRTSAKSIYEVNIKIFRNLLAAVKSHSEKTRVILASGCLVYPKFTGQEFVKEVLTQDLEPISPVEQPYRASKLKQEIMLTKSGLDYIIVRPTQYTGPGKADGVIEYFIGKQLSEVEEGKRAAVQLKNINGEVDLLDSRDVATAYLTLIEKGESGSVYHLCTSKPAKVMTLVKLSQKIFRLKKIKVESETYESFYFRYSSDKLRALGWRPKYSLTDALTSYFEYFKNRKQE